MENQKLITVREVAELLSVKPKTIYQWAELRQIPSYKLNGSLRFCLSEIEEWIKAWHRPPREGYNVGAQIVTSSPKKGGK